MSRTVRIGRQVIGGGAPVAIQSMTNTDTRDVEATSAQIRRLYEAGCQLARVSVYDTRCAQAVRAVSYTHLDVYKRQGLRIYRGPGERTLGGAGGSGASHQYERHPGTRLREGSGIWGSVIHSVPCGTGLLR